jgi:hypothetical protein
MRVASSSRTIVAAARGPRRQHVDGIELDDDRADLIEDDQLPGVIRRNILWGSGPS